MTKLEIIELIKLLSAMETLVLVTTTKPLPENLRELLIDCMQSLEMEALK